MVHLAREEGKIVSAAQERGPALLVSGRAGEEMQALRQAGIDFEGDSRSDCSARRGTASAPNFADGPGDTPHEWYSSPRIAKAGQGSRTSGMWRRTRPMSSTCLAGNRCTPSSRRRLQAAGIAARDSVRGDFARQHPGRNDFPHVAVGLIAGYPAAALAVVDPSFGIVAGDCGTRYECA